MKNNNKRTFLYICAHPDDDILVGGTMKKLSENNWDVYEIVCTPGKTAIGVAGEETPEQIKANRLKEVTEYCKQIGANKPYVIDYDKNIFVEDEQIVFEVAKLIREIKPDVIVLMNKDDYHFEHTVSHQIGLRGYEIASRKANPELGEPIQGGVILQTDGLNVLPNPLVLFDTSTTHEAKIAAVYKAYPDRVEEYLNSFLNGLATMRGSRFKYKYAEAFELINPTWHKFKAESAESLHEFVKIGSN